MIFVCLLGVVSLTRACTNVLHLQILGTHESHRDWLCSELDATPDSQPVVVVTHHLPSLDLVHPAHRTRGLNSGYATSLDDVISKHGTKIRMWCCGHTHEHCTLKVGGTLLITNPVGYPGESRVTSSVWTAFDISSSVDSCVDSEPKDDQGSCD